MIAIRAMATIPMLLVNLSIMSSVARLEVVENSAKEINAMTTPTLTAVVLRGRSSLSFTADTTTSSRENKEVKPAIVSEAKKNTPKTAPSGIWLMIAGNAMKAKPIPEVATSLTGTFCWVAM